jgi:hypothetical protein
VDTMGISVDTCPLCQQRALSWHGSVNTCLSCGSVFEVDLATRRCRYTYVAPEYAVIEPALTRDWISRREVFDIAATLSPIVPASRPSPPLSSLEPVESRSPFKILLMVFLGIVSLIPILCACLAILVLAPGMSQTRQMIAAANVSTAEVTQTIKADSALSLTLTPVIVTTGIVTDLQGQIPGPEPQQISTRPVLATVPVTTRPVITPITPLKSPIGTPFNVLATPGANQIVSPALLATFTPIAPLQSPLSTPTSAGTPTITPTATPILVIIVTATVTPLPSPTPTPNGLPIVVISSTVVISTVMYAGTPALNMSDQYIEVQNRGSGPVSIGNWKVYAESANRNFYFTNGLVLLPGLTCRVYGSSPPANASSCGSFSFNSPTAVWSNILDTALLYNAQGELVGSYTYNMQR